MARAPAEYRRKNPRPTRPLASQRWIVLDDGDPGVKSIFETDEDAAQGATQALQHLHLDSNDDLPNPLLVTEKQDANRLGLFDLPSELRIQIYGYISKSVQSLHDNDDEFRLEDNLRAHTGNRLQEYHRQRQAGLAIRNARFADLQVVSQQLHSEFLATWAEQTVHHAPLREHAWSGTSGQSRRRSTKELSTMIWTTVRKRLRDIEDRLGVASNVRHIKLSVRLRTWLDSGPAESLARFSSNTVAGQLDRLDETLVHPELVVEVEMERIRRARRTVFFTPNRCASGERNYGADWTCVGDRLEARDVFTDPKRAEWVALERGVEDST